MVSADPRAQVAQDSTAAAGSDPQSIAAILDRLELPQGLYPKQKEVIYYPGRKFLVAGGERAGKSFTAATYLTTRAPYGTLFWLVGPDYEQATPEFDYTVDLLSRLGAIRSNRDVSRPKIGKCTVVLKTGQLIETKTAQEIQKLAGKAPDGIVMCEAAQHPYESYLKCVARVAERRGWLFMCGTFEGSENWYADYYTEWSSPNADGGRSFSLASWDNTIIYPGGRQDPEILNIERALRRIPGLFEERCAAVPVAPMGLVFREVRRSIHFSEAATFDPDEPVYLAVDPSDGALPYAVGAYQFRPCKCTPPHTEDRIEQGYGIDEIYETGMNAEQIIEIAKKRPWWKQVRGGAIDVEAPDEQRRWQAHGGIYLRSEKIPQLHGIRRLKSFVHYVLNEDDPTELLEAPHLIWHPQCEGIAYEFKKYKRRDPSDSDLIPKDVPVSNQPNHHIKAAWYLLVSRYGFVRGKRLPKPQRTHITAQRARLNTPFPS